MMDWEARRWHVALGTDNWRYFVSFGGVLGFFNLNIKHLQVIVMSSGKPHWPRRTFSKMPEVKFFDRVLAPENTRWTSMNMGIQIWPISLSVHWHATCHGCVEEYGRDHTIYQNLRRGPPAIENADGSRVY